jgi:hypothetical protein
MLDGDADGSVLGDGSADVGVRSDGALEGGDADACSPPPPIMVGSWTRWVPEAGLEAGASQPSARAYAGLAYGFDGRSRQALLFGGGSLTGGLLDDAWGFDPSRGAWSPLPGGPSARGGLALSFTAVGMDAGGGGSCVMFGGLGASYLGDTWAFSSGQWSPVCSPDASACGCGPCARAYHAMAYDVAHGQVVLFGGRDASGPMVDTWVLSANQPWSQRCAAGCATDAGDAGTCCVSPPARSEHAMAYDASRRVVVLFGGKAADGRLLDDTWEWDGARWSNPKGAHAPTARSAHAMATAPPSYGVIVFGGTDANGLPADPLWTWNGTDWSAVRVQGMAPIARPFAAMTSLADGTAFLFGGGAAGEYNDSWELSLAKVPSDAGCGN